jgi:hypothetical protein
MKCQICGCPGHGTTRRAVCALCGEDRWPTLLGETPEGWTCVRCSSDGATVVRARQEAAVKAQRTRRERGRERGK